MEKSLAICVEFVRLSSHLNQSDEYVRFRRRTGTVKAKETKPYQFCTSGVDAIGQGLHSDHEALIAWTCIVIWRGSWFFLVLVSVFVTWGQSLSP